jgi:hypothetical protein
MASSRCCLNGPGRGPATTVRTAVGIDKPAAAAVPATVAGRTWQSSAVEPKLFRSVWVRMSPCWCSAAPGDAATAAVSRISTAAEIGAALAVRSTDMSSAQCPPCKMPSPANVSTTSSQRSSHGRAESGWDRVTRPGYDIGVGPPAGTAARAAPRFAETTPWEARVPYPMGGIFSSWVTRRRPGRTDIPRRSKRCWGGCGAWRGRSAVCSAWSTRTAIASCIDV